MAYIGRGTENISNVEVLDNLTFDGSASYTLQKSSTNFVPSSANNLLISISGVVQQGNFSVSGSTITFDTTVSASDTCDWILHYGTGLITTPADGTVSNDKIAYPLVKSGATVSTFNRTSSDGTVLDIQKDGTSVGSVVAESGDLIVGNGDTALRYNDALNAIYPANASTGASLDNTLNLGWSSVKWANLYMGGNIYLGGTGTANALDDYEEGEYQPTISVPSGSLTLNTSYDTLRYTKIGRMVNVSGQIRVSSVSSPSGTPVTVSLPFANNDGSGLSERTAGVFQIYSLGTITSDVVIHVVASDSYFRLQKLNSGTHNDINGSEFSGDEELEFNLTYFTNS